MVPQLLIVDDDESVRESLAPHFRRLGYQVETAEDGIRAIQRLEALRVDIVIADVAMPGVSGVDLLREIRADYPMIRVIMLAGYVSQEQILACMRHGAEACVFKPLGELVELEDIVAQTWKRQQQWWQVLAGLEHRSGAAL